MRVVDQLGMIRLELPAGWTEFPGSSGLFRLAFVPWTDDVWMTLEVYGHRPTMDPSGPGPAETRWLRSVADAVEAPARAHVVEWPVGAAGGARAVFVHDYGDTVKLDVEDGSATTERSADRDVHHRDALIIVDPRYDVVVRCWVSGLGAGDKSHAALRRIAESLDFRRRLGELLEPDALNELAVAADGRLKAGEVAEAESEADKCLDAAQVRYQSVASRDGSEAARGLCALPALKALSLLTQIRMDPWLARDGAILAQRTVNSLRNGDLPEAVVKGGMQWLSHFQQLQLRLIGGDAAFSEPTSSAAMAGARQLWALSVLSGPALATSRRIDLLDAALADASLRVVDARLTAADGIDGLGPCLLMGSGFATLLSTHLTIAMDVERAQEVDDVAIALADAARAMAGDGVSPTTRRALVQALLTSISTLGEIGDEAALDTARERLDRADAELDALGDEGALRAWACLSRDFTFKKTGGDLSGARKVIERGLAAAQADPATPKAHMSLLRQAKARLEAVTRLSAGTGGLGADLTGALAELESAMPDFIDTPAGVTDQSNAALLGDSLVRHADLLRLADRFDEALALVVRGIGILLRVAPFGTDTTDGFRVAAAVLRDASTAAKTDQVLRLTTIQGAMASMDVRQALFGTDEGRLAATDAERARVVGEEYVAEALRTHPLLAFGAADGVRANALARLVSRTPKRRTAAAMAALDALPEVPAPSGDDLTQLRRETDWMAQAANKVLLAAGAPVPLHLEGVVAMAKETASLLVTLQPVEDRLVYLMVTPEGSPEIREADATLSEITELSRQLATGLQINVVGRGNGKDAAATSDARRMELQASLVQLSRLLVPPIEEFLANEVPIIVSPYRELWPIPFGLLTEDDGRHLIESHAVSLAPSVRTLSELRARGPWDRSVPEKAFVAGDPLLSRAAKANYLKQLQGASQEALDVAARLRAVGTASVTVVCREKATEDAYVRSASGCDLVHLACHAMLEEPAMTSCLFLAESENHDGNLTAREIPDVMLDDAVVVLSACQTAQGRPTADGLVGLARSYLIAGARAVVASNWQVSDMATKSLIMHLYDTLLDPLHPPDLARALQKATLATRTDLAAGLIVNARGDVLDDRPAHWAPFVAVGDCSSVRYADHSV